MFMKILQINKFHFPQGGADAYYLRLSELLRVAGHRVVFFSTDNQKNELSVFSKYFAESIDYNGGRLGFFKKAVYAFRLIYNFEARRKLVGLLEKERVGIAHLHNIYHQLSPAIIGALKKRGIPVVMHLHDYKIICPNYKLFRRGKICERCVGGKFYHCFFGRCLKNSYLKSLAAMIEAYLHGPILRTYEKIDLFIAPSEFMKNMAVRHGIPEAKIAAIPNFSPAVPAVTAPDGDYFFYFGRLSEEKGLHVLLEAMKYAPAARLKIAGDGPLADQLRRDILRLGLENRVEMLGRLEGEKLGSAIAAARAVIAPSIWHENMPLAVLEALARGKAVIASRAGGLEEIIQDGENGFLFEAGNRRELGKIIGRFDRRKFSAAGQALPEKYSAENHLRLTMDVYQKVLANFK